jgi:hypothetical protein
MDTQTVSEPFGEAGGVWRKCLSCDTVIEEKKGQRVYNTANYGGGGVWS